MGRNTAVMVLFAVVALAVTVDVAWCWGEETYEESIRNRANEAAGHWRERAHQTQQEPKETVQDTKENEDSWADWAIGKFSGGNGAKDSGLNVVGKAEEAASKSTETMQTAASGTSKYASQKAINAAEKLGQAKDVASEKAIHVMNKASNLAGDAKATVSESTYGKAVDAYNNAVDKAIQAQETIAHGTAAGDAYNYATQKVKESVDRYAAAKESMGEQAREMFIAAKEKTPAGNAGEKMKNTGAEL